MSSIRDDGEHGPLRPISPPSATYRLQFNAQFTFADAAALVPYLHELGVSHCYASPYLKARTGSHHGYDIVDHNSFNPEIGSAQDFEALAAVLERHGMGQILDMVPNHMGVGGSDNQWWLDVLENGQASRYAEYFDIDWYPIKQELRNKVLLPFLGGHYGDVLECGELTLAFDAEAGSFSVWYYHHRFPVDPKSYPLILDRANAEPQGAALGEEPADLLAALLRDLDGLPSYWQIDPDSRRQRAQYIGGYKARLADLCRRAPAVRRFVEACVATVNGRKGDPSSFDKLHHLLERQAYRLAYWQVASREINYRRFFDINDLAGLRMENDEVFQATHRFVLQLIARGRLHGLRIDHVDGLSDPLQYCRRLRDEVRKIGEASGDGGGEPPPEGFYLVVEKILATHEYLQEGWPVDGTTGYEFANLVNGVFVFGETERVLSGVYRRFIARHIDFDDLVYECKKLIMDATLSSELNVLANLLNRISEADRHARDFTVTGLREALAEIVACFPVYRTYINGDRVGAEDRRYVDWAVAQAKKRTPATDIGVFDFIHKALVLEWPPPGHPIRPLAVHFAMRFQQYTAPVLAKSLEDTASYIYNRLVSLNEVGGDPRRFSVSVAAFHHLNQERLRRWPHAMICSSTHDTKRGEDVRARINVISELGEAWRHRLGKWSRWNRRFKPRVDDALCPSRNDEYLIYQTLTGIWPLQSPNEAELAALRGRLADYMIKAAREAKVNTSWIKPNEGYEQAMRHFIGALLGRLAANPFLSDFMEFHRGIARFGLYNSLAQLVLKLTAPGVPDIYQGNELWCFSLVDPDNRQPVDYPLRRRLLRDVMRVAVAPLPERLGRVAAMLDQVEDGRLKLYLTWRLLSLRRALPGVFAKGEYTPLQAQGEKADHLCAFTRSYGDQVVMVAVPRWFYRLYGSPGRRPVGGDLWRETWIELTGMAPGTVMTNVFTGQPLAMTGDGDASRVTARELFHGVPFAVLHSG